MAPRSSSLWRRAVSAAACASPASVRNSSTCARALDIVASGFQLGEQPGALLTGGCRLAMRIVGNCVELDEACLESAEPLAARAGAQLVQLAADLVEVGALRTGVAQRAELAADRLDLVQRRAA